MNSLKIDNIHCSSCEDDILKVVKSHDPHAKATILGHETVNIENVSPEKLNAIRKELYDHGFDVNFTKPIKFESANRNLKHSEICRACSSPSPSNLNFNSTNDNTNGDTDDNALHKQFRAVYACEGITCASCAQSITSALAPLPTTVDVLSGVVYVLLDKSSDADSVRIKIEDAGFDATLTEVLPLVSSEYELRFNVRGMTCASCSNTVHNALTTQLPNVNTVSVDPIAGTTVIRASKPIDMDLIKTTIEDVGYNAEFNDAKFELLGATSKSRTVTLEVHNIFCERCPERIMNALKNWGDAVEIIDSVSLKHPFVKFTYIPSPPSLTIRSILSSLQLANENLRFDIVKHKSLEELAAENQEKERKLVLKRLVLTSIIAVPLTFMMFSDLMMNTKLMFILATPVYFVSAASFHSKAIIDLKSVFRKSSSKSLKRRLFHFGSMNLLMSLGTSISYWVSVVVMLFEPENETDSYFDSVVFLTFFLLIGRYLDIYSKIKTTSAVSLISNIRPDDVDLVNQQHTEETIVTLPLELIEVGDVVNIAPGCRSAVDGIVLEGESDMNEAMLTGESLPVRKQVGDEIYAGTLNSGLKSLKVRVTAIGKGTLLNDIVDCVRAGQLQRAPIERYVEEITGVFVPVVIYLAILVWIVWYYFSRDFLWSMHFAVATFVVACPCGIGLAAPTALYVGSGLAAKYGILARGGGEAFQEGSNVDLICFDKTGTVTKGNGLTITDSWRRDDNDYEVLQIAKLIEGDSVHPLATAVIEFASQLIPSTFTCKTSISDATQIETNGRGVSATILNSTKFDSKFAVLGNEASIINVAKVTPSKEQHDLLQKWKTEGKSVIILSVDSNIELMMASADEIRPESLKTVKELQSMGISVYMISGDNYETAVAVGQQVGIPKSNIIANVLPQEKAAKIKDLQKTSGAVMNKHYGRAIVGMVGDGVNDAPALATSDLGIALGRGADIALQSSQFVLLREDLRGIPILVQISKKVMNRVKLNFFWAGIYNIIAIPVAAGVLYPFTHRRLDPVWASLAMAMSSVSVMTSSLLLRRYKAKDL